MPSTEMTPEALAAASAAGWTNRPIFMVNLLRYNEQASYGVEGNFTPCTGREAYFERYVPAFAGLTQGTGIKAFWVGNVLAGIVTPPGEEWDDVAIVEYPTFEAFQVLVESDEYKETADPHRAAALADWRLITTAKMDLPG